MEKHYDFTPGQRVGRIDSIQTGQIVYGEVRRMEKDGVTVQWEDDFIPAFHGRDDFDTINIHSNVPVMDFRKLNGWDLLLIILGTAGVFAIISIVYCLFKIGIL